MTKTASDLVYREHSAHRSADSRRYRSASAPLELITLFAAHVDGKDKFISPFPLRMRELFTHAKTLCVATAVITLCKSKVVSQ